MDQVHNRDMLPDARWNYNIRGTELLEMIPFQVSKGFHP